ncbi:GNAT family N-acetyltransferase [Paenibacillus koleovorans]|uniref:GNAT family N-acetyltransferase n=1 Tax=Paenibacillus koleovorans TaxID=121608 RepID=UPI000FDC1299|nr:GNAT family N-acetyltransferase [Paenibacillus koleovorans]
MTHVQPVIRTINECTYDEAVALWNGGFSNYYSDMSRDVDQLSHYFGTKRISPKLSVGMFIDGQPVGFVLIATKQVGDELLAWNGGTGVCPEFRGTGLARPLMQAAVDQMRDAGVTRCYLEVVSKNVKAIAAYEGAGFQVVDSLIGMKRDGALGQAAFGGGGADIAEVAGVVPAGETGGVEVSGGTVGAEAAGVVPAGETGGVEVFGGTGGSEAAEVVAADGTGGAEASGGTGGSEAADVVSAGETGRAEVFGGEEASGGTGDTEAAGVVAADGTGGAEAYRVQVGKPSEVIGLPFFPVHSPWSGQWFQLLSLGGDALTVTDTVTGEIVGYALYHKHYNHRGELISIVLHHCEAAAERHDADAIVRTALAHAFGPHELAVSRQTDNLRATNPLVLAQLEAAGFELVYEQKLMVLEF